MTCLRYLGSFIALAVICASGLPAQAAAPQTQTFNLSAQWNLITFQVIPADPSPAAVFGQLPGFQAAWSYDATLGLWQRYIKPAASGVQRTNDLAANQLLSLPPIEPGRAYWVFTSQSVSSWQVTGTVPAGDAFRSLDLKPGWNMIGIPAGVASATNSEPVSLLAVLTAAGFDYDALLTWESQSFRKMFRPQPAATNEPPSPLEGLPPDPPFPAFDLQKDLGRGYWIRVLDPAVIRPRLVTSVRPDQDTEPLNNFPSKEDLNVSGGAQAKNVQQQDVIRFFPGEDIQTLGIANVGVANQGGGLLIWEAVWTPSTDPSTPEPWIRLFASPDQREQRDQDGKLVGTYTNLTGVTTLESDTVYLRLDRKNLGRGVHQGTLLLRTSVGDRTYSVIAEVPGVEGDFQGYAVIGSVNGRRNPVPDVDLSISFYEDTKTSGLIRGLIDTSQSLLWPVDVPLIGYRVSDANNRFLLTGSFVLPPGDQNGEPFDVWQEGLLAAGADVDWRNDGVMDTRNPFPFPIQRTVSLEGSLVTANPTEGYILEGKYQEVVYGMSRQPIRLSGEFHLERKALRPLSSRQSTTQDTGVEPVVAKSNRVPLQIPAGESRESVMNIQTEMELQSLQVSLAFNPPLAHSTLLIKLVSPGPNPIELIVYDGRTPAGLIDPKLLETVNFPIDRPPFGDLQQFLQAVPQTRTAPGQPWKLVVQNSGAQTVTLGGWTLRLEGQPVADVFGVVKNGSLPLPGVQVSLDGAPFSLYSTVTDAQGRFSLSRVPLIPLNFSGTLPGFAPPDPSAPGLSPYFTRPFATQTNLTALEASLISRFNNLAGAAPAAALVPGFDFGSSNAPFELNLQPQSPGGPPQIAAGPLVAFAGSTVDLVAVNAAGTIFWDFGDQGFGDQVAVSHVYPSAGVYRVRLYSPAESPDAQDTVLVVVLPAPGNAPARPADLKGEPTGLDIRTASAAYTARAFQTFLTTGGVVPAHKVGVDPATGADRYVADLTPQTSFVTGETNIFGAAYVSATPLQMAYSATADIDLAPRVSPPQTTQPFASDGFVPLVSSNFNPAVNVNSQGFKQEDFNYSLVASLWENTRAINGANEYFQDPQSGLIVWGNTTVSPTQNYSVQTVAAFDGTPFTIALDDDSYHPHQGTTVLNDLASFKTVTHYRMTCSLGAVIVTAPANATSIKPAKLTRDTPEDPFAPQLLPSDEPLARNLYYRLHTGFLGTGVSVP